MALGAAAGRLLGAGRRRRQTLSQRRRAAAAPTSASFDLGSFNWNPLDFLKVPRDQAQLTLYPWMAGSMREMAMRRWLQKEVRGSLRAVRCPRARMLTRGDVALRPLLLCRLPNDECGCHPNWGSALTQPTHPAHPCSCA